MVSRRTILQALPFLGASVAAPAIADDLAKWQADPETMTVEQRRDHHLAEFKRACEEIDPNIRDWSFSRDEDRGTLALIAFVRTGRYEGDGLYESGTENIWGKRGQWHVKLRPGKIDGHRSFTVQCPGEWQVLTEPRLDTFIGRRLA
ncbi:MAG: hypothetical protein J0I48_05300 [Devosia sp.]|uniref:hypothetical protein n=1 Tax=Devosia sp. 66-22 TaxID=1895753 RepID=UPI000928C610|nr:hypothetical protein [Devosia sp. 66-22]MBN9345609.1 hypothetical protein [Devosia sp.]OJX50691.1 MAG: hypothetical protein BGO81_20805 [Devosia sp. 66-22]